MPLKSIVVVGLRLCALLWVVEAMGMLGGIFATVSRGPYVWVNCFNLLGPAIYLAFSAAVWFFALPVATLVCRGEMGVVNLGGLTRRDLYLFACVMVGLYLSLSSLGSILNWIHYFLSVMGEESRYSLRESSLYNLSRCLISFATGVALLLAANRWANLLVARDTAAETE